MLEVDSGHILHIGLGRVVSGSKVRCEDLVVMVTSLALLWGCSQFYGGHVDKQVFAFYPLVSAT